MRTLACAALSVLFGLATSGCFTVFVLRDSYIFLAIGIICALFACFWFWAADNESNR